MKRTIRFALVLTVLLLCVAAFTVADAAEPCTHENIKWDYDTDNCWKVCADCGTELSEHTPHTRYCNAEACLNCGGTYADQGITFASGENWMKPTGNPGEYISGNILHHPASLVWKHNDTQCYRVCSDCPSYLTKMLYADYHTHIASCKGDENTCCFCGCNRDTDNIILQIGVHHNYEWKHDETGCWEVCADCGKTLDRYTHRADCTDPEHCVYCGKTAADGIVISRVEHCYIAYSGASGDFNEKYCDWLECMLCHDIKEAESSPHVTYCDELGTCEYCGLTKADGIEFDPVIRHRLGEPVADKDKCWFICSKCDTYIIPPNEHYGTCEANSELGIQCLQCGKTTVGDGIVIKPENVMHTYQGKLAYDDEGHWPVCSNCNEAMPSMGTKQGHCGLCKTIKNGKGTCYACGAENVELTEIAHSSTVSKANATEGWSECQGCGEKTNVHKHVRMCMDEMMYGKKICLYCGPEVQNEDDHMEFAETVHTNGPFGVPVPAGWYPSGTGCCLSCMACYAPVGEVQPHVGKAGELCKNCSVIIPEYEVTISKQPVNVIASTGGTAKFTVKATGEVEPLTYQWQYKTPTGSWKNSPATGSTTAALSVEVTAAKNGYSYRCVVTDPYGDTATSKAVVLTAVEGAKITKQPANATAAPGTNAVFTVTATGDELTYQWQYRKSASGSWANSPATGNKTASLTVEATAAKNGYGYRCVVTDKYGTTVNSNAATLTVANELKITKQPASVTAATGTNATFTVTATGDGLTYQWQYRKSASGSWANSPATGSTTASLTVEATASRNGFGYRCNITDKYGNKVSSNAATLTVQTELKITKQPANVTAATGTNATFTVTATGDGLTYQWQYRKSASGSWVNSPATGSTTASLTVEATASRNGFGYRCNITDKYGKKVSSNAATLTVQTELKITKQPASVTAAAGTAAKFTVTATGDGLTYQWQYRKSASGSWANSPATGSTTATLTVDATTAKNGYGYRCVVKDKYGKTVNSNAATLTVKPALKITGQPVSVTAAAGTNAKFTVTATGDGLTYQWQYKTASGSWTNSPATGNKTASVTIAVTAAKSGYSYRCIVKDASGNTVTSTAAVLTVK